MIHKSSNILYFKNSSSFYYGNFKISWEIEWAYAYQRRIESYLKEVLLVLEASVTGNQIFTNSTKFIDGFVEINLININQLVL